jgi:hypothetical protein
MASKNEINEIRVKGIGNSYFQQISQKITILYSQKTMLSGISLGFFLLTKNHFSFLI